MRSIAIVCTAAWLLAGSAMAWTCPEWIVRGDGFRECDATILANYHADVAHVLPRTNALEYALAVLIAHGGRPPILIVASPDSSAAEELKKGITDFVRAAGTASGEALLSIWLKAIKWVRLSRADYSWPQDVFFSWVDTAGTIHITERPMAQGDQTVHAVFARRVAEVLNSCGRFEYTSSTEVLHDFPAVARHAAEAWEHYAGGNLEGVGAGLCLTSTGLHEVFLPRVLSMSPIEIDISFLAVGHVDELFSVLNIPTGDDSCSVHVLWASPRRAMEIISARADLDPELPMVSDALFDPRDGSDTFVLSEFFAHLESNDEKRPMRNRVGDLLRIHDEEELFRVNVEMVDGIQRRNLRTLTDSLRSRHPRCSIESHAVPVLFANRNYWLTPEESASNFSLYANQVNSVFFRVGNAFHAILVNGQIAGFNDHTVSLLRGIGVQLRRDGLFDASVLNRDLGNLHCATQMIHACDFTATGPSASP